MPRHDRGIVIACCCAAAVAWSAAHAEVVDSGGLETILVTGTRIEGRSARESASPLLVVPGSDFARRAATSVEAVLGDLPQFVMSYTSTSSAQSNGGQANLNLRGLGTTATLVLLDGRRVVPSNGDGVVDVNLIPPALVESVEVLTGGVSVVYGSDAIAGVVNLRLLPSFEGLQFDGTWQQTDRRDGTQYSFGMTAGVGDADDRIRAYGYAGHTRREGVSAAERAFSATVMRYDPATREFFPAGSGTVPDGVMYEFDPNAWPSLEALQSLFAGYGYAPRSVPFRDASGQYANPLGFNADGTLFTAGTGEPGSVVNYRGAVDPRGSLDREYTFNVMPWTYLQLPLERTTLFGRAAFDASPTVELFAQALYARYEASLGYAPAPAFLLPVPVGNPLIPADLSVLLASRLEPQTDVVLFKRLTELGPRRSNNEHTNGQLTFGANGTRVFASDWSWNAYVQLGRYDLEETQRGNALRSKIRELTRMADGGRSVCEGGLDLFGPGSISSGCARYIATGGTNRAAYDQWIAEASTTGSPVSLPAGDLQLALGLVYRSDEFRYRADPIANVLLEEDGEPDIIGFDAAQDLTGRDTMLDAYAEALLPLLRGRPYAERLDAIVGYRSSESQTSGGANTAKTEFVWVPVDESLRLRASWQRAVRAPSVFELYLPQLPVTYGDDPAFGFRDPCSVDSDQRHGPDPASIEALCVAQGVPVEQLANFHDSDQLHFGVTGGNPDLEPETADTLTLGVTVDFEWPSGLHGQLAVDAYRIDVDDAIVDTFAFDYVPRCFDSRSNRSLDASFPACRYFTRDATGQIDRVSDLKRNIAGREVAGIDVQLTGTYAIGPGVMNAQWLLGWMDRYEVKSYAGAEATDEVGRVGATFGASLPRWKSNLELGYQWRAISGFVHWRHVHAMHDRGVPDYRVPGREYVDLHGEFACASTSCTGLSLYIGIENLTDAPPPLLPSAVGPNTDASQYDVLGRSYTVGVRWRL